jgi:lysyl-tRNA synthetase class 2
MRRARIIRALRGFFEARDFTEVDTYITCMAPAPELHIEAVAVRFDLGSQGPRQVPGEDQLDARFLQTSPELPMKRLLAAGLPRIFQIAPVFRDGDFSDRHRPEFRLLEWYRRDASWETLFDDCEALLTTLAEGRKSLHYRRREYSIEPPFLRISIDEAFRRWAGFSILNHLETDSLRAQMRQRKLYCSDDDTWDDLFHRVFVGLCEPPLAALRQPVFVTHYPTPLAALARQSPADARVAERVELFLGGLELANGFGELTNAATQRHRFVAEKAARASAKKRSYPLDERFLSALEGLPQAAGIAVGLERLLMVLCDAATIDDVVCIPWTQT